MQRTSNQTSRLFERLLQDGKISRDGFDGATRYLARLGGHPHEALIEVGAISETDLLKYLAQLYKTRFVSTERLSRADIDPSLIKIVSRKVADRLSVFPVLFNRASEELSIVACDFEDDVGRQVQVATGIRNVKVYVGRAAAIRAAIRRHYEGDRYAFSTLLGRTSVYASAWDAGERALQSEETSLSKVGQVRAGDRLLTEEDFERRSMVNSDLGDRSAALRARPASSPAPVIDMTLPLPPLPQMAPIVPAVPITPMAPASTPAPSQTGAPLAASVAPRTPTARPSSIAPSMQQDLVALDVMQVLVTLLESSRGELRGHSSQVARLGRQMAERMGLSAADADAFVTAAYLHDLGKTSNYHLTALNVAEYDGHRTQAQKTHLSPLRLFEGVRLPKLAVEAITHLYERFDGQGFPDRLTGQATPLGARMLAIVETFCDLTQHARNPYRKTLTASEACDAIAQLSHRVFDPNLVDLFRAMVLGGDLRKRLLEDRHTVLLIDPDPEDTTILELRLIEHGYEVIIARSVDEANAILAEREIDLFICEVELSETDGFAFLEHVRMSPQHAETPLFFLTKRSDRESVHRGFGLGAADYVVKPASADVVVAKARRVLEGARRSRVPRGVMGQLRELPPPEMIQLLANGRKSGVLRISSQSRKGEIALVDGEVHHASWNAMSGADAFYAMLVLTEGDFVLDPTARPAERTIFDRTETLLLEGMRIFDETNR